MKTKDFIKMLQDEDPNGECHVRINGLFPMSVEQKEGYWDGPYSYIDEKGNYIISTQGSKIDVYCMDIEDFVYRNYNRKEPNNWGNIKKKIKFDFTYSDLKQRKERENSYIDLARKSWEEINEIHMSVYNEELIEMRKNAIKGWKWFQNKDVDKNKKPNMHIHYTWKIFNEKGEEENSNVYNTESVMYSGEWGKIDNNEMKGYYEWKFITK